MVPVMVRVPRLGRAPAAALDLGERGRGIPRIDDRRLAAVGIVDQPDVIVGEGGDGDDLEHHQTPVLGIDAHGSAGPNASPFCRSSTEIASGLRTNAMRPSRGGRLIVTPASWSRRQVA